MTLIRQPESTRNFQVIVNEINAACGLNAMPNMTPPQRISSIIPSDTIKDQLGKEDTQLIKQINEAQSFVFDTRNGNGNLLSHLETLHRTEYAIRYNSSPMDGIAADLLNKSHHILEKNGIIPNRLETENLPALEHAADLFKRMQTQGIITEDQALRAKASAAQTLEIHKQIGIIKKV